MFSTKRVGCFLNTFSGHGDDTENKELKLVFHVSPITQPLAAEISPLLADRLFRLGNDGWEPAREISKASFANVQVQMQNIEFHPFPDADLDNMLATLVPGAAISNLRAARSVTDGLDFRLEFDVVIPMDNSTMRLVEQYYKATAFLTMEAIQRDLPLDDAAPLDEQQRMFQEAADAVGEVFPDEPEEPVKKRKSRRGKEAAAGD